MEGDALSSPVRLGGHGGPPSKFICLFFRRRARPRVDASEIRPIRPEASSGPTTFETEPSITAR